MAAGVQGGPVSRVPDGGGAAETMRASRSVPRGTRVGASDRRIPAAGSWSGASAPKRLSLPASIALHGALAAVLLLASARVGPPGPEQASVPLVFAPGRATLAPTPESTAPVGTTTLPPAAPPSPDPPSPESPSPESPSPDAAPALPPLDPAPALPPPPDTPLPAAASPNPSPVVPSPPDASSPVSPSTASAPPVLASPPAPVTPDPAPAVPLPPDASGPVPPSTAPAPAAAPAPQVLQKSDAPRPQGPVTNEAAPAAAAVAPTALPPVHPPAAPLAAHRLPLHTARRPAPSDHAPAEASRPATPPGDTASGATPSHAAPSQAAPAQAAPAPAAGPILPPRPLAEATGNVQPIYPEQARQRRIEGRVVLRIVVSPQGRTASASVAKSSGSAILDQAALDAVRDYRFIPASQGGVAVVGIADLPFNFRLED